MDLSQNEKFELIKLEYEHALAQYTHHMQLRRQDMAFVSTVQVAVLTIIGKNLLHFDLTALVLSIIAFLVLLMGLNNERRTTAYMIGYIQRANEIETLTGMSLNKRAVFEVKKRKLLISNTIIFPLYYVAFFVGWIVIWLSKLYV